LAHAFGQRYDLPLPLLLFVGGGAAIVLASFLLIAPRTVGPGPDIGGDDVHLTPAAYRRGTLSVVITALLIVGGLWGSQEVAENILPTLFWLVVWIAVPLSCAIVGDWTQTVNPFAFLAKVADRPRLRAVILASEDPVTWPSWLGWWPAVVLFFIVACGELVFNLTATIPANTALALLAYGVVSTLGGLVFGPAWRTRGELFTVLFATWGRLGYFRFGSPGRSRFAGGLDAAFEATGSRLAFVLMLLISVNFDGLLATPGWNAFERRLPGALPLHPTALELWRAGVFIVLALVIAALFGTFAWASDRAGRQSAGGRAALAGLLPSLLPIAFGYLLAHNIEYLAVNSQLLLPLIGNPTGLVNWPVHLPYPFNDDFEPHAHFLPSAFYWYVSVAVIVAVHVVAVVIAHRRLGRSQPTASAARAGEYPWLAAMVAYTMLSLWLLAQPLVKEKPSTSSAMPARVALTQVVGRDSQH
jgi:hypothetical protein